MVEIINNVKNAEGGYSPYGQNKIFLLDRWSFNYITEQKGFKTNLYSFYAKAKAFTMQIFTTKPKRSSSLRRCEIARETKNRTSNFLPRRTNHLVSKWQSNKASWNSGAFQTSYRITPIWIKELKFKYTKPELDPYQGVPSLFGEI